MAPESAQKMANAPSAGHTDGVKSRCEKTSPPSTKRFFTPCGGRSETTMPHSMRLEPYDVGAGLETAGGVARVDQERCLGRDARPVVAVVRGEHEHHVVVGRPH